MKLCGYFIGEGTSVGIAAPVISHNEDIYGPDTDAFRPERWLEASEEQLKAMDRYSLTVSLPISFSPLPPLGITSTDHSHFLVSSSATAPAHASARTSP
jgi:hypothetical protein